MGSPTLKSGPCLSVLILGSAIADAWYGRWWWLLLLLRLYQNIRVLRESRKSGHLGPFRGPSDDGL